MGTTARLLAGISLAAVIGLFVLKNSPSVHLDLLFIEATVPLFVALGASFLAGVLLCMTAIAARGFSRKRKRAERSRESLRVASSIADEI